MTVRRGCFATLLRKWFPGLPLAVALAAMVAACSTGEVAVPSQPASDAQGNPIPSFSQFVDLPIPAGATMNLAETLIFGGEDRWTGRLSLDTELSPDEAYEFFQREMPNYQWAEITALRSEVSILTLSRLERVATITIEGAGFSGSKVVVTVSPLSPAKTSIQ